jgi:hypothetical protein
MRIKFNTKTNRIFNILNKFYKKDDIPLIINIKIIKIAYEKTVKFGENVS